MKLYPVHFEWPSGWRVSTVERGVDRADAERRAVQFRPGATIIPPAPIAPAVEDTITDVPY